MKIDHEREAMTIGMWFGGHYYRLPLEKALAKMTDGWIDSGNNCQQTTADLRDALKALLAEREAKP